MPAAIETRDLTRTFDDVVAVDHVSLVAATGVIYGLLGSNGAGTPSRAASHELRAR